MGARGADVEGGGRGDVEGNAMELGWRRCSSSRGG